MALWHFSLDHSFTWSSANVGYWRISSPLQWMCCPAQDLQCVQKWRWTEEYSRRYGKFFPQGWWRVAFHDDKWTIRPVNDSRRHGVAKRYKGQQGEFEDNTPLPSTTMSHRLHGLHGLWSLTTLMTWSYMTTCLLWLLSLLISTMTTYLNQCLLWLLSASTTCLVWLLSTFTSVYYDYCLPWPVSISTSVYLYLVYSHSHYYKVRLYCVWWCIAYALV